MTYKDLYFIYNPLNNSVKIGISENPKLRLKRIKDQCGVKEMTILFSFRQLGSYESIYHKLFRPYNTMREWFEYDGVVKSYVEYLGAKKFIDEEDFIYIVLLSEKYYLKEMPNLPFLKLIKLVDKEYEQILKIKDKILNSIDTKILSFTNLWEFVMTSKMDVIMLKKENKCANIKSFYMEKFNDNYEYLDWYD